MDIHMMAFAMKFDEIIIKEQCNCKKTMTTQEILFEDMKDFKDKKKQYECRTKDVSEKCVIIICTRKVRNTPQYIDNG